MSKLITAVVTLIVAPLIYIAVNGHGVFSCLSDGPDNLDTSDTTKPIPVVRPSDVEAEEEAKRVASMQPAPGMAGHNHGAMTAGAAGEMQQHAHQKLDVSQSDSPPNLEISVVRDAMSGWNLKITTTNFRFAPERVNGKHVMGEGHAHIYLNGEKIARTYGEHFHIPRLEMGENLIEVTLNTNSHEEYAIGEDRISRKVTITER